MAACTHPDKAVHRVSRGYFACENSSSGQPAHKTTKEPIPSKPERLSTTHSSRHDFVATYEPPCE